jgi:3,4-dihydroxy-9,10-secoandrosta-1,3,5(10)-triene-9,17-dione 4,5-dioxygenase
MRLAGLGYLGLATTKIDEWTSFALDVVGLGETERASDGTLSLRLDDHLRRMTLRPADESGIDFIGWELHDRASFDAAVERLESLGVDKQVVTGDAAMEARRVRAYVAFRDPAGLPVELFYGPLVDGIRFMSRHDSRFVTGDLGLGHVFLMVDRFEETCEFYEQLGFRLSDRTADGVFSFYRCNPRQHSLGLGDLAGGSGLPAGLQHFMVQYEDFDAVGRAYDACLDGGAPIATTFGRHSNDRMLSFYVTTPDGWDMELGHGGIRVDEDTWVVSDLRIDSVWGHRPVSAPVAEAAQV